MDSPDEAAWRVQKPVGNHGQRPVREENKFPKPWWARYMIESNSYRMQENGKHPRTNTKFYYIW
jgi:hypothetical protein